MAKKVFVFCIVLILSMSIYAQIPDAFNYQAVIRNASDEILSNQDVGIRISIYEGNNPGTNLFSESHSVTTDTYGVISVGIGNGTLISGNFLEIDWTTGNKYLKVEVDEAGGSSYTNMGMAKLLSVPYALSSKSAENLGANNIYTPGSDTLFVVKDYDGNVVFAVFPDGAAVYVNEGVKGKVGGFAVSGRSPNKATEEEYLVVTVDSTRIYYKDTIDTKGKVGGFAISGRSPNKGSVTKLMDLTKKNYFIGHEAGINTTEGLYNTFLGYYAGYTNNGYNNIFIGDSAGFYNENGSSNIFIGNTAGKLNTSGYRNIFFGNKSGYENQSGRYNVFIGDQSGVKNTTGQQNVFIGATTGYYNSTGVQNVFVGNWCGYKNTEGTGNIFLGNQSGWNNTVGNDNIFIGTVSGLNNTSAGNNIFIGNSAGYTNATGTENIFIGKESGYSNVEGDLNVCIGFQSGYSLTTGNYNSYLGFWSGYHNTSGTYNTFIGAHSGYYNFESNNNVFLGSYTASDDTIGSENTFLGAAAGRYSSGHDNTFVGAICGTENKSSHHNVYVGAFTGRENLDGNYNVFIGHSAGYWTNASNNTFIGHAAGANATGSNNVFVGYLSGVNETGSNKLYIENSDVDSTGALIWGDFTDNKVRINGQFGVNIEPTGNTIEAYYGEGSGSIMVKGTGNDYSYSRLVLMSDEAVDQQWQIYHNLSNNFEIVCNDGTTWYNGILELDKNGVLTTAGSILPKTDNAGSLGNLTHRWSVVYASNGTVQTSDFRLKDQIKNISYGLDAIIKLRPVSFRWKNESSDGKKLGLIAQEVQPVISEVVHVGNDEDKTLGINYSELVPVLIKGIQEQQQLIKKQQERIDDLENRLVQLEILLK
ncbi:MAG: tail fiber domain-containing protein [Bacteroidetes bacterium]|nr:tail fiber domain-containing protein [Bacteroidota bacterium]